MIAMVGCSISAPLAFVPPGPAAAGDSNPVQSRTLLLPWNQVFPKVLDVLMDMGYQIRCADEGLGQVNIYQTWYDETRAARPELSLEATLLFRPQRPGETSVRIVATGRWNWISSGRSGSATVTEAQPALASTECRQFLDQLEARLRASEATRR
jgi:hypothetical protein